MAVGYQGIFSNEAGNSSTSTSYQTATLPLGSYLVYTLVATTAASSPTISDNAGGTWITAIPFDSTNFVSQTWFRTTKGNDNSITVTISWSGVANYTVSGIYFSGSNGTISSSTSNNNGTNSFVSVTSPAMSNYGNLSIGVATGINSTYSIPQGGYSTVNSLSLNNRAIAYEARLALNSGETFSTGYLGSGSTFNKIGSFVILNTPETSFSGWGIPLS